MARSFRDWAFIGLCAGVALLVTSPAYGQERVKLTGAELQEMLLKSGEVSFGVNPKTNMAWIIVHTGEGKRDLFWRSLTNAAEWGMEVGLTKIAGDQLCTKWTFAPETCVDVYRIGENKYESRTGGELTGIWHKALATPGEPSKEKVKMTEADLQAEESQRGFFAGVNHIDNVVWMSENPTPGKRFVLWRSLRSSSVSGSAEGAVRIAGDQACVKFPWTPEECHDNYRMGEKYEEWIQGKLKNSYYRLK
jgi:hypothetical protein